MATDPCRHQLKRKNRRNCSNSLRTPERRSALRDLHHFSYEALAKIPEIPIGTVKSRLFTAHEELCRIWLGAKKRQREKS
jgi:DNA-directed RNA polymerase specialized sigma24 family protein